jgi:hypothetical protein
VNRFTRAVGAVSGKRRAAVARAGDYSARTAVRQPRQQQSIGVGILDLADAAPGGIAHAERGRLVDCGGRIFVMQPGLIAPQQDGAEPKEQGLGGQNDPIACALHDTVEGRNSDEGFVAGRGEETSVGPGHVCVVPVEPTPQAMAIKNLRPADRYHCKAQDREHMEKVEAPGQMIDAERGQVQHEHGENVSAADYAMASRALHIEENKGTKNETRHSREGVEDRKRRHSDQCTGW